MADKKISQLTGATTPLAGTEVLPIVQGGNTVKVSVSNLTAGRTVSMDSLAVGAPTPATKFTVNSNAAGLVANFTDGAAQGLVLATGAGYFGFYNPNYGSITFRDGANGSNYLTVTDVGNVVVNQQNLVIGTAGKGIDFSANAHAPGMTSELLNWYETGTWTPLISADGTGSPAFVSSAASGKYTRIGNIITVTCLYTYSSIGSVGNSFAFLSGLPFTSSNDSLPSVCAVEIEQSVFDTRNYQGLILPNSRLIAFQYDNGGGALYGGAPYMLGTSFPASGTVRLTATYFV